MDNIITTMPSPQSGFILESQGNTVSAQQDVEPIIPLSVTIQHHTIIINLQDHIIDIMAVAINNRTRERNYFKLYSSLLENKISDEEFDRLIDENPDMYVQESYRDFSPLEIAVARKASEKIMDIEDLSDMATLFSISNRSIHKCIAVSNE